MRKLLDAIVVIVATVAMMTTTQAAPVSGQGTWETTLQARDLTGDGIADAYFDTDLNITWLRNASVNGAAQWQQNFLWAAFYGIGGYFEWRLPSALNPGDILCNSGGIGGSVGPHCANTEMGHLWFTELGNPVGGPMTNTGDFQGLQSDRYWLNEEYGHSIWGYSFNTGSGYQDVEIEWALGYAMAVHAGDIGTPLSSVPEPESYALTLAGLGVIAVMLRRRKVAAN